MFSNPKSKKNSTDIEVKEKIKSKDITVNTLTKDDRKESIFNTDGKCIKVNEKENVKHKPIINLGHGKSRPEHLLTKSSHESLGTNVTGNSISSTCNDSNDKITTKVSIGAMTDINYASISSSSNSNSVNITDMVHYDSIKQDRSEIDSESIIFKDRLNMWKSMSSLNSTKTDDGLKKK
ncbi:hypothetical protein HEP_00179100 [Hepatocystis sp. ex Piliocolobus tephrosceles]|nr:hypothetical protein HEP_00179100 [Hepatocystis sp. ex Piliocolobus tephrosceles]